ncbi:hypothetical protein HYY74_03025 [Candidatus Woesearchaeota archaeon]|nr:hypothetical protein [Candidatus Woesearchaeota archaeon]
MHRPSVVANLTGTLVIGAIISSAGALVSQYAASVNSAAAQQTVIMENLAPNALPPGNYRLTIYHDDVNRDGIFESVVEMRNKKDGRLELLLVEREAGVLRARPFDVKEGRITYRD